MLWISIPGPISGPNNAVSVQDWHCEAMHAENSLWVSHQGEPSIWYLLVAQKSFVGPHIRDATLVDILKRMHSVTRLLHGSVQRLLNAVSLQAPDNKISPCLNTVLLVTCNEAVGWQQGSTCVLRCSEGQEVPAS